MLDLYIFLEFKHFVLIVVNVHKYDILDFLVHIWKKIIKIVIRLAYSNPNVKMQIIGVASTP